MLYGLQKIDSWRKSPNIKVTFYENKPGYRVITIENNKIELPSSQGPTRITLSSQKAMYVSICVTNTGKSNLQKCRGFLVGIDILINGTWKPTNYCDSIPLAWSFRPDYDSLHGIDIPQEVNQFLNVFSMKLTRENTGFRPATIPNTSRQAALETLTRAGEFRFRIQVGADSVPSKIFGLYLRWDGEWDDELWKNILERVEVRECTDLL